VFLLRRPFTVFADPLARIFEDPEHSETERREIIIGHSNKQNLILVSFVEDDRVRLFSARKATRTERRDMKKTSARKRGQPKQQELRSEYRFDYRKSKPNRFASKMSENAIAVVLEPTSQPSSNHRRP